jgi:hypothetical protein
MENNSKLYFGQEKNFKSSFILYFMSDDYACGGNRNKKKDKMREKKKNPYKAGGRFRTSTTIKETNNTSKKVTNIKKSKHNRKK